MMFFAFLYLANSLIYEKIYSNIRSQDDYTDLRRIEVNQTQKKTSVCLWIQEMQLDAI